METIQRDRHPLLPQHLSTEELANWLISQAVDRFTDKQKRIFTPEELQEFEHESSVNGREINRLVDLLADCADHVKKGSDEAYTVTFPATNGTKVLDKFRRQNDDLIEAGFEFDEQEIFGIVSPETETMEYFGIEGNHVAERSRSLSAKEKHDHIGLYQKSNSKLFIQKGGKAIDTDTGEELENTGS